MWKDLSCLFVVCIFVRQSRARDMRRLAQDAFQLILQNHLEYLR
jgi:hypothetical protein